MPYVFLCLSGCILLLTLEVPLGEGKVRRAKRAYERFLQSPVVVVLVGLWLAGMTILSFSALTLYRFGSALIQMWL